MKLPRFLVRSLVIMLIMFPRLALAQDGPRQLPKLVLQITIDQLRGDMPTRFIEHRLSEGGFRYLLENGIVYADAHQRR